jgi:SAM-dependent methyltransferase
MNALVERIDRRFYPTTRGHWDAALFRQFVDSHMRARFAVLDLGAGRGAVGAMDLRRPDLFVAGVDVDPAVLANPFLDDAELINPDGSIPYDDQSFDIVVAHNVLEHLADPLAVFREVYRVLRPGGTFLSKTPNRRHYVATIARWTPHPFHVWVNRRRGQQAVDRFPTVYRCNTPQAIEALAARVGFMVESINLVEGRPEYLRGSAPSYVAGLVYERIMNSTPRLARFRAVMLTALRKGTVASRANRFRALSGSRA